MTVLEDVHTYFAPMGSKKISNLSHEEEGYKATSYKDLISYQWADSLKVDPIEKLRSTSRKPRAERGNLRHIQIEEALTRGKKRKP
jgi:hypothetical protein